MNTLRLLKVLVLLTGLALGAEGLGAWPVPAAAAPPLAQLGKKKAPSASEKVDRGLLFWLAIGGTGLVVLVILGVGAAIVTGHRRKVSSGPTSATEDIIGNYRLLNLMWPGQTSQVWEAVEMSSHRHFAIKLLLPERANNPDSRKLLFHEAETGKQLAHPNLIRIVSVGQDNPPHFVMDHFPGGNLKTRITRKEDEFIRQHALSIFKQAATAFAFMNANGWVHRDIKPENILVNANGEVRVIDFAITQKIPTGLKKLFHSRKGPTAGTLSYMSPEQIRNEVLDGRADIYSFGAMAYEVVTGRPPFRGASNEDLLKKHLTEKPLTPKAINPMVTDDFANLVVKMLAKNKDDRPRNFHEILMALQKMRVFKAPPAAKKAPTA